RRGVMADTTPQTEEAAYLEGYASFAKTLRTWLVAYGVGGPALIAAQKSVGERLAASGCTTLVVVLFLSGAVLQVVTALVFKCAMWAMYMGEREPGRKSSKSYGRWRKVSDSLWLEMTLDCLSILAFSVATLVLVRAVA